MPINSNNKVYIIQSRSIIIIIINYFSTLFKSIIIIISRILVIIQAVFLDHNNHMTTFIDPRLPYPGSDFKRVGEHRSGMVL